MAGSSQTSGPIFPVEFDSLALAEDLARLSDSGIEVAAGFRRQVERDGGVPRERLMACQAEARDGTRLGGCLKTYAPWPAGRYGAVMVAVNHVHRAVSLRVIAFGVRHHPRYSNALTVYEIADRRLNA